MKKPFYTVAPRYTPGSPAMVPQPIAEKVAEEEKRAYQAALTGVMGEAEKAMAETFGLRGIVEAKVEQGSGKSHGWKVTDLCTHEQFVRLSPEALKKLKWQSYEELDSFAKAAIDQNPPRDASDHRKGFYRVNWPGSFEPKVDVYRPDLLIPGFRTCRLWEILKREGGTSAEVLDLLDDMDKVDGHLGLNLRSRRNNLFKWLGPNTFTMGSDLVWQDQDWYVYLCEDGLKFEIQSDKTRAQAFESWDAFKKAVQYQG